MPKRRFLSCYRDLDLSKKMLGSGKHTQTRALEHTPWYPLLHAESYGLELTAECLVLCPLCSRLQTSRRQFHPVIFS